jgi:hypothetical protein
MLMRLARKLATAAVVSSHEALAALLKTSGEFITEVIANRQDHYSYFELPKPNGGFRPIQPPKPKLKLVQRSLLDELYRRLRIPPYLHGGLPGRSAITHAKAHVGKRMVATLDISSFYGSTRASHIVPLLEEAGFAGQALYDLIELVTINGALAQGAPSSCLLANLAFICADVPLRRLCRRHRLDYTRFVDDIAVSGDAGFHHLKGSFLQVVKATGFEIAAEKTQFRLQGQRQVVTGLVVNQKLRPTKLFIAELKADINLCRLEGPSFLADLNGMTVRGIKAQLNGRVAHVLRCDEGVGKRLKRLLHAIRWNQKTIETGDALRSTIPQFPSRQ